MKYRELNRLQWLLLVALLLLVLGFEYFYSTVIEKHEISGAIPEILFFGIVITLLVMWSFSMIKFRQKELEEYSSYLEKKVEERAKELKESEEKYRSLIEATDDFVFAIDSEGKFMFANTKAIETFGDLIGKSFTMAVPPEYHELVKKNFSRRMKGEVVEPYPIEVIDKKGNGLWVEISGSPLVKDGKITGAVYFENDITEQKKAEIRLRESEEKFRIIFESAPDAYYLNDLKGRFIDGNKEAERITGYRKEELIGKSFLKLNLLPKNQLPKAAALLAKNALGKPTGPDEFTLIRKDSSEIEVEIVTHPVKIEGKTLVLGIARDITERKKAEEALRESEEKYRHLVELSPDPIVILQDGVYKFVNTAFCDLFGYSQKDVEEGLSFFELVQEKDKEAVRQRYEDRLAGKPLSKTYTTDLIAKDGRIISCETTATRIDFDNRPADMVIMRDITERKNAEEEMKRRLMKYKLEDGNLYLVKERLPSQSLEAFNDLLNVGYSGLVISRESRDEIEKAVKGNFEFLWLAERGKENAIPPKLGKIEEKVNNTQGKKAVLIDRLDYLIFKNGFKETVSFVQRLREMASISGQVILLTIDPTTLLKRELRFLEKEAREIELLHVKISQELLECLRFVYERDLRGLKTSYHDVSVNCRISMPTVRKRVRQLIVSGYLSEHKVGKNKIVEVSEFGRSFLLK